MEPVKITYRISLAEKVEEFTFQLDAETFELISDQPASPPKWAALDHQQCSHCPLNSDDHPYCPVASQLIDVVERFHDTSSIDEVEMEVITEERRVIQETVLQRAIASMLELIFPACGCPKTEHMRPLARFHLPLASEEENVFRVTSMYLLGQYFLSTTSHGGRIDFQGLIDLYSQLGILNKAVASRLRGATKSDSVKNAIALLDMYSTLVPLLLEDELVELRGFFRAFLPQDAAEEEGHSVTTHYLKSIKEASLELLPLEENKKDEEPDRLREARGEKPAAENDDADEQEAGQREESAVDDILNRSKMNLELVPLDEQKDDEEEKPKTGRASVDTSDD